MIRFAKGWRHADLALWLKVVSSRRSGARSA
jgi:hypothetical protein